MTPSPVRLALPAMVLMEEMHHFGMDLPPYYDSGGALGHTGILR